MSKVSHVTVGFVVYQYTYVMNNPLKFTDPSGYMPDWVQDEYDHYYRNGGGDDRRNEGGGGGWNPFGWISRSMNIGGWTKNPGDYWHYSSVSGTYYNSETGERRQANNESTKSVLNDAGGTIYGIYEIAYSLDYGENFIRTGKYRMIKEGTMKSNGMFPTFASKAQTESYIEILKGDVFNYKELNRTFSWIALTLGTSTKSKTIKRFVSPFTISKYFKAGGPTLTISSLLVDYLAYTNNQINGGELMADAAIALYSFIPVIGSFAAIEYAIIDTFYPDGIPGFASDYSKGIMQYYEETGHFRWTYSH